MSDIVERLRAAYSIAHSTPTPPEMLLLEAANEIERLRALVHEAHADLIESGDERLIGDEWVPIHASRVGSTAPGWIVRRPMFDGSNTPPMTAATIVKRAWT